jgi:hypothetical protein
MKFRYNKNKKIKLSTLIKKYLENTQKKINYVMQLN